MQEKEAGIAVITKTWYKEGNRLEEDREWLLETAGLGIIMRNRRVQVNGVAYGGVALVWSKDHQFREVVVKDTEDYEVLVCAGSLPGHSRMIVVVCCYIPPNYVRKRSEGAVEHLVDILVECKRRFKDPYVVMAGDFNQWRVDLGDFADMEEVPVGHTRKDKSTEDNGIGYVGSVGERVGG